MLYVIIALTIAATATTVILSTRKPVKQPVRIRSEEATPYRRRR